LHYELTRTDFEGDADALPQAQRGHSRDHRPYCQPLVLALIVTPRRLPAYRRNLPRQPPVTHHADAPPRLDRTEVWPDLPRAHWTERDPAKLWQTYVQLTEAEAAFRTLKSEVKVCPIWHWTERRVEAQVLVPSWATACGFA
jgi:hypothetical protein